MKNNKFIFLGLLIFVMIVFSGCSKKEEIKVAEDLQGEGQSLEKNEEGQSLKENENIQSENQMKVTDMEKDVIDIEKNDKNSSRDLENLEETKNEENNLKENDSTSQIDTNKQDSLKDSNYSKKEVKIDEGNKVNNDCLESGGVYNSIMEKCYYDSESNDDSTEGKETDDPKAQKCIDEGGVYNNMVEECFE